MKNSVCLLLFCIASFSATAQTKPRISVSGQMGASYEGYGLTLDPHTPFFYAPRRPWNQVRVNFAPQIKIGKNFTLPFNFNFVTKPTNFISGWAGITALGHQNLKQFITNPLNNFSINPKYKWAELQLGTQYLNYSELSTGDIGVFGIGFDLRPKNYLFKFFTGTSQAAVNYVAGSPGTPGAYRQNNWMAQIGKEKEGKYKVAFNFAKGNDFGNSSIPNPLPSYNPHEGFVVSFLSDVNFKKGYYLQTEMAQGIFTSDKNVPAPGLISFQPFIKSRIAPVTQKDYAATASFGKKTTNFDIGFKGKYLGAGYRSMGYPYQQPDRLDATVNTRLNIWKDSNGIYKMNVVASIGNRINNLSNTAGSRASQLIGMLNWFTQFSDHFSLNVSYNNFGFTAPGTYSSLNPNYIKNVSNDIGINPVYTWSNSKMSHLLSASYNFSKYKESVIVWPSLLPALTNNTTHTALLTYVPTYFNRKISPDFSLLYFSNAINPGALTVQLATVSAGLGLPFFKDKIKWHGQLQYTFGKTGSFTPNNNVVASMNIDYALTPKINWNTFMTTNYFKYGNELAGPPSLIGANYLESTLRTGIRYKWK